MKNKSEAAEELDTVQGHSAAVENSSRVGTDTVELTQKRRPGSLQFDHGVVCICAQVSGRGTLWYA